MTGNCCWGRPAAIARYSFLTDQQMVMLIIAVLRIIFSCAHLYFAQATSFHSILLSPFSFHVKSANLSPFLYN
jgi:hypothetical protein